MKKFLGRLKEAQRNQTRRHCQIFILKKGAGTALDVLLPPIVVRTIKDAFSEFSSKEKQDSIKELKALSKAQLAEISKKLEVSTDYLKDIRDIILYSFEELQTDREQIRELLHRLIEIQQEAILPTIQSVLKKGLELEGTFFRKEPIWVDFEKGYVVERREVNEILEKLKKCDIHLVLGAPATGKSVVLKNVGFKLAKECQNVYFIELKKYSQDQVKLYFKEILRIKDEVAIYIIDDAHLQLSLCETLVREFRSRRLKAKILIGSRPILEKSPKEASEFEYLDKTLLRAEDVAEEIIETFLKRKYHLNKKRIKTISEKLEKYKKDLWCLSWALKTYNPEKDSVNEEEIYEKIKDWIRSLGADVEDVLLPMSTFYKFDIPLDRSFLEQQMRIKKRNNRPTY